MIPRKVLYHCLPITCLLRYIGWLKNFISDRNAATENLVTSYSATTLVRGAPTDVRTSLLSRWVDMKRKSTTKSFLPNAEDILGRETGRAGLHQISFTIANHNTRRLYELNDDLRMWYDDVEPDLHVYQLNARAVFRKNGFRITPQTYVSYVDGTNGNRVSIGIVVSITVGCRAAYPRVAGCAVCAIRVLHEARIEKLGESANVIVVNNSGPPSALELV